MQTWLGSLIGRRGYRAPPRNQFLIDVSRLEKYHRKRFAMLKSWQNVPHTIFMQISDAITGKRIFRHISANSVHTVAQQLRYLTPCFEGLILLLNYSWSDQMCLKDASVPSIAAISGKKFPHISTDINDNCIRPNLCNSPLMAFHWQPARDGISVYIRPIVIYFIHSFIMLT